MAVVLGFWFFFFVSPTRTNEMSVRSLRTCFVLCFILSFSNIHLLDSNHLVVTLPISSLLETGEPPSTKTGCPDPLMLPFIRQSDDYVWLKGDVTSTP